MSVLKTHLAGVLRVATYLGVVSAVLLYHSVHSAYAEGERTVRRLGERLVRELGPTVGSSQALRINGQTLFLASTQSELPVRELLDHFEASCASGGAAPGEPFPMIPDLDPTSETLAQAPARVRNLLALEPRRFGIVRQDGEEEGHISCLVLPEHRRGFAGVIEGARELLESGDLSRLGDVRYAAVTKLDNGKSRVITLWSDGAFRIDALFPGSGDAPGTDMADVPRPPDSTRLFSAAVTGEPYGIRIYESQRSPREVLDLYDHDLPSAGWMPLPTGLDDGVLRKDVFVRSFLREGRMMAVGVEATPEGRSDVSLIELGTVQHSRARAGLPARD